MLAAWRTGNIQPLDVSHDSAEKNGIVVRLSAEDLGPPDGVFTAHRLVRLAFLVTQEQGLTFDRMTWILVGRDGAETTDMAISLQAGFSYDPSWGQGERLEQQRAGEKVAAALTRIGAGVRWRTYMEDVPYGRLLQVHVTLGDYEREAYTTFLEDLMEAMGEVNGGGAHIAVMELSVDDRDLQPVLRSVYDFQLWASRTWHAGEQYRPPWMDVPGP